MKKKLSDRFLYWAAPPLGAGIIRTLGALVRIEWFGEERLHDFRKRGNHVIFAFWHDQILLMLNEYRGPGLKIMISASKDGELIARTASFFGLGAVRGSSSRGGGKALLEMVRCARGPFDLAITPDGPRGPRHQVKEGVALLARLSGRAVVPVSFACSRGYRFSSWDRFLLPFPFSRGVFVFGEPLLCRREEDTGRFRDRLQSAMKENDRLARERLEEFGVSAV